MTAELLPIVVKSPAFAEGQPIPVRHTGDGEDLSPPLTWSGVPHEARSLVVLCEDPDAPRGNWTHWVLFNLPPGHWDKGERGYTALPGRDDDFASAVDLALRYAETLRCPKLHALAGLTDHGARRDTYISNLKLAAQWAAPSGVSINSR